MCFFLACSFSPYCSVFGKRLLPRNEPEVHEILQQVFQEEGITVIPGKVVQVTKSGNGHIATCQTVVPINDDSMTASTSTVVDVAGDVLLVSVGRVPNVQGMGLETMGVQIDSDDTGGGIVVDETLQTTVKGVYAAGDCTGDRQL